MKKVLTIAGSDCSGGAGIQADIKTITAHKAYAMSVITALTAQNTTGVYGILDVTPEFAAQQIDCVFTDIFPDAVKIGMVSNIELINIISDKLSHYQAKNIVVDPVMISTSGDKLLNDNAVEAVISKLFPLAALITPNIPEAETLSGIKINNTDNMLMEEKKISAMLNGAILLKGGHLDDRADDLLYLNNEAIWIKGEKINNPNTHGTGCTLSSAIACNLAAGHDITASVQEAKKYISGALKAGLDLGKGSGPLNHVYF
jgi:hydroxymethylpyrimidine/phosphomethylpyrimidine kinase